MRTRDRLPVVVSLAIAAFATLACTGSSVVLIRDAGVDVVAVPILDAGPEDRDLASDGPDNDNPAGDAGPIDATDAPAPGGAEDGDGGEDGSVVPDVAEDAFDDIACPMVAGRTFVSQTDQFCGEGVPPCRGRMTVGLDGVVTWTHDGVVQIGTVLCKGAGDLIISIVWDDTDGGVIFGDGGYGLTVLYYAERRQLNVNTILYDLVP